MITFVVFLLLGTTCASALSVLCKRHDVSCSSLLSENLDKRACWMKYYNLSSDQCSEMSFNYNAINTKHLGNVRLHAVPDPGFLRSYFHVIFTDISWTKLKMRFFDLSLKHKVFMCRTFTIWDNITISNSANFTYDCPFCNSSHMGRNFTFEYEMSNGDFYDVRKFYFILPSFESTFRKSIENGRQLFSYIDVTNTQLLQLRIQTFPKEFNVTEYKVEVFRERSHLKLKQDVRMIGAKGDEIKFDYNTWNERGYYYFLISAISRTCPEDNCLKTLSAKVFIGRKSSSLVIAMVGAFIIITSFMSVAFIMYSKQHKIKETEIESDVKVLLIYLPSIDAHNKVVMSLAQVLQKYFGLSVLLDVNDIPKTEHKNPLKWCANAFETATHIVYVASPNSTEIDSIYRVYSALLRFLYEEINRPISTKQIVCVTFPYTVGNIPDELKIFRCFSLMKKFDSFCTYLRIGTASRWYKRVFNKQNDYELDPAYVELVGAVEKACNEPNIPKVPVQLVKPTIKITDTSDYIACNEANERDSLILHEDCYSFNIADLDLSGKVKSERKTDAEEKVEGVEFNIVDLVL